MFGLQRHLRIRRYRRAQEDRANELLEHVLSQLEASAETNTISGEGYLHEYILGILDAVTATYEAETRRRVGLDLHRRFFVDFLSTRLACRRADARRLFDRTRAIFVGNPRKAGVIDGLADGLAALRLGHKPDLLSRRLATRFASHSTPV